MLLRNTVTTEMMILCLKAKCLVLPDNPIADFTGLTPESLNFYLLASNQGVDYQKDSFCKVFVFGSCHLCDILHHLALTETVNAARGQKSL